MEGANTRIGDMLKQSVQESVAMSAQIVEVFARQMESRVEQMINDRLGGEKNTEALQQAFPSMSDPAMAPVIQGVFNQAMKHTKDRAKALDMTRDMLKAMGQRGAKDLGFDKPPANPDDNIMTGGAKSLVDELMGRT
jgi:hypothetical protein